MPESAAKAPTLGKGLLLKDPKLRVLVGFALLSCLVAVVYSASLRFSFLNYDDNEYITENRNVRAGLSAAGVKWAFCNIDIGHWQPVTWLTHLADTSAYGLNPAGHHLTSVLIHAFNVLFLFALTYWLTKAYGRSLMVAALFAVHPVNVEVVAWLAERKTLVCAFFTFATVAAYVWYAGGPRLARYFVVMLAFLLAVMSKSMAVTVPVLLLVMDCWVLGRWNAYAVQSIRAYPRQASSRLLLEKVPLLVISGAIALLTLHAQEKGHAVNHDALGGRIAHALWSYVAYIGKLIWPANLSILYPYPVHGHAAWAVGGALVVLVAITLTALRARSKPYFAFGWFFYIVAMLPVIGIVRVGPQSLSDHYLYVPAIGVFVVANWGAWDALRRIGAGAVVAAVIGGAVILSYALVTARYLPCWANSVALFTRAESLSPAPDDMIENNLAEAFRDQGRPAEAVLHYRRAIALAPQMPLPHCNLGSVLLATGEVAGAIKEIQVGLQQASTDAVKVQCLNNLAVAQLIARRPDLAARSFGEALQIDPSFAHALVGRGMARVELGDLDGAIADLQKAVEVEPDSVAYFWLGKALASKNERKAALDAFQKSLALAPGRSEVQVELQKLMQGAAAGP